jgi:hypothetical protein
MEAVDETLWQESHSLEEKKGASPSKRSIFSTPMFVLPSAKSPCVFPLA